MALFRTPNMKTDDPDTVALCASEHDIFQAAQYTSSLPQSIAPGKSPLKDCEIRDQIRDVRNRTRAPLNDGHTYMSRNSNDMQRALALNGSRFTPSRIFLYISLAVGIAIGVKSILDDKSEYEKPSSSQAGVTQAAKMIRVNAIKCVGPNKKGQRCKSLVHDNLLNAFMADDTTVQLLKKSEACKPLETSESTANDLRVLIKDKCAQDYPVIKKPIKDDKPRLVCRTFKEERICTLIGDFETKK